MGKGKQWTLAEDTALAEAWVHVAENAQQDGGGSEDKSDTFWGSVHDQWVERLGGSQRTQQALKNHWTSIQRAVRKFGGYAQLALEQQQQEEEGPDTTGSSSVMTTETKAQVLQKYLEGEGESFELDVVWEILSKSAKWHGSKTPGSALKRSRLSTGLDNDTPKTDKRRSLSTNGATGTPVASVAVVAAAADAVVAAASADARSDASTTSSSKQRPAKRLSLSDAALVTPPTKTTQVADRRLPTPEPPTSRTPIPRAPAPTPSSSSSTPVPSSSNNNVIVVDASPSQTAYSTSVQRLADSHREKNEVFADQMLQTLILANTPETKPSAEKDNYAASISKLADAQIEKNELVADQMLMTMLLADSADPANRRALEQLKDKYLKRAFQKTNQDQANGAQGAPGLISATVADI